MLDPQSHDDNHRSTRFEVIRLRAAIPTPFDDDGNVDVAAFERFANANPRGCHRTSRLRNKGEAPTLRPAEHHILVRIAVDVARGRVPVIAGAGPIPPVMPSN